MKADKINLKSFWAFCKGFDLVKGLGQLSEPDRCFKSNRMIYQFLFMMSALGKGAFLQMDQAGRFEKMKRLFKTDRFKDQRLRHCVVSDTTLIDRLKVMNTREVRRINYAVLRSGLRCGLIQPIAFVDGSRLSGRLYSCLCFMTRWGDVLMVDCEAIEKHGKELLASQRVIQRCCEHLGKGMIQLLLVDMLYFNERFYHLREAGYFRDLLIKYTPDPSRGFQQPYRKLLQRFEDLRELHLKTEKHKCEKQKLYRMNFKVFAGDDKDRGLHFEMFHAPNNSLDNRYAVCRVIECHNQTSVVHDFYVITTAKPLSAQRMRQLGHQRWYIENDGFKRLNAHLGSKRIWSKHPQVLLNLIHIWMIAMSLMVLFGREVAHLLRKRYRRVKVTRDFLIQILTEEPFGRIRLDGI